MEYKIKKAKIKKMSLEVEMEEIIFPENASPITNDVTKKSDQLIHEDLRVAFDKLKPHLVLICEQIESDSIQASKLDTSPMAYNGILDNVQISGFVIGGDDNQGVTIIGSKNIDLGTLNIISPFVKYDSDYQHGNELAIAIDACVYEVEQYLFEGKCAVKQMELPFYGEGNEEN
jgi:hypothetical protein